MTEETKKEKSKKNIFLIIGLAGSGKTTFFKRLNSWLLPEKINLNSKGLPETLFTINLDPASINELICDYDIKENINYEQTLGKYQLGPNGGILTCLNLQTLNFPEILDKIDEKVENIIIDTPGQIEAFSWSSSGKIIIDLLKNLKDKNFQLNLLFLIDSTESGQPNTFMTNMTTACIIKYRFDCPMVPIFTKIDAENNQTEKTKKWLESYDAFRENLEKLEMTYENDLLSSLALHFEDIYSELQPLAVSSLKNVGKKEFLDYFQIKL